MKTFPGNQILLKDFFFFFCLVEGFISLEEWEGEPGQKAAGRMGLGVDPWDRDWVGKGLPAGLLGRRNYVFLYLSSSVVDILFFHWEPGERYNGNLEPGDWQS